MCAANMCRRRFSTVRLIGNCGRSENESRARALNENPPRNIEQPMKHRSITAATRWVLTVLFCVAGLPAVAAAQPFFFIQLSDPQFGMFTGNKDFAQETANFEFAVAAINRLKPA